MKQILELVAVLVFPALLPGCTRNDAGIDPVATSPVEEILVEAAQKYAIPGIGAVVAKSDEIVDLQLAGVKRMNHDARLDDTDPFHIGSVAKTFTATVIAKLVEEGKLEWNTPVADVLSDTMQSANSAYEGVTLSHLLSHEAGLQPMEEDAELEQVPELTGDVVSRRRQFARWIFQQEPVVTPLLEYRYSNAHFVVAAAMAEAVSGSSWEELVEERIFGPLDMGTAGFGWAGKNGENVPWGHMFRDGSLRLVDPNGDYQLPQYFAPAGDIHASLPDMGRYFQAYLASWHGKSHFLEKDTLRHMWTRRLNSGLGWGATKAFGHEPVATYSGSADTFLMVVVLIPDADVGVAVAANAFSDEVEEGVITALRAIVKHYIPDNDEGAAVN